MVVINELLQIKLLKRNGRWCIQASDEVWHFLNRRTNEFKTDCVVTQFFIDNLEKTIGLQGTPFQSLVVTKEQVADWIINSKL